MLQFHFYLNFLYYKKEMLGLYLQFNFCMYVCLPLITIEPAGS